MSVLLERHVYIALSTGWDALKTAGTDKWIEIWQGAGIDEATLLSWWEGLQPLTFERGYEHNATPPPAVFITLQDESPNNDSTLGFAAEDDWGGIITSEKVRLNMVATDADMVTALHYLLMALMINARHWFLGSVGYRDMVFSGAQDIRPGTAHLPRKTRERAMTWGFTAENHFPPIGAVGAVASGISMHGSDYVDADGNPGEMEGRA